MIRLLNITAIVLGFTSIHLSVNPVFGNWLNMNGNLPPSKIHALAVGLGTDAKIYLGTDLGAFIGDGISAHWQRVMFAEESYQPVTHISATTNRLVNCPCYAIFLGTLETSSLGNQYSNIFHSFINEQEWEDTAFPSNSGLVALMIDPHFPMKSIGAFMSPVPPSVPTLCRRTHAGEWQILESDTAFSSDMNINFFCYGHSDTNEVFMGTSAGLYRSTDGGVTWEPILQESNVVAMTIPYSNLIEYYIITNDGSYSDGVYCSRDEGVTWEPVFYQMNCVDLVHDWEIPFGLFLGVRGDGVYHSRSGEEWQKLADGLPDKSVTKLAADPRNPNSVFVGTETGIYKYKPPDVTADLQIRDDDLAFWPPNPVDGELVKIYATIHNLSGESLQNVQIAFTDNADGILTVIVPIDTLVIPSLAPYSSETVIARWYPVGQVGENLISVDVDPNNKIPEVNKTNNHAVVSIALASGGVTGFWRNITADLPDTRVNGIATHPFERDSLFLATNDGIYYTSDIGRHWKKMSIPPIIGKYTQIRAGEHPFLDWTVPVLWVGTEEYTDIPEDRLGRVFFSEDGGGQWQDEELLQIAVTAIEIPYRNSLEALVGMYNPFYYMDGFFVLRDTTWFAYDLTHSDTLVRRINCIEVDEEDDQLIFCGTDRGIYITTDGGYNWQTRLDIFNICAIHIPYNGLAYAATSGSSYSDGIYRSADRGQNWEIVHYRPGIVEMIYRKGHLSEHGNACYIAVNGEGVFQSLDECVTWNNISEGLTDKRIDCLTVNKRHENLVYVATPSGLFRYDQIETSINEKSYAEEKNVTGFTLYQNFPNPFNAYTRIKYDLQNTGHVDVTIFDIQGKEVITLENDYHSSGFHSLVWNGEDTTGKQVTSGVYLCRMSLSGGDYSDIKKIVFTK